MKLLITSSLLVLFAFRSTPEITGTLQQKATAEEKHIAIYFSGSDWCGVCYKFKQETLAVPEIDSLLNSKFVYYTADFPQRTKLDKPVIAANEFLAEKLNPDGNFPLLVITDANWNIKAVIRRGPGKDEVLSQLQQLVK